jgi:hypothetical protein
VHVLTATHIDVLSEHTACRFYCHCSFHMLMMPVDLSSQFQAFAIPFIFLNSFRHRHMNGSIDLTTPAVPKFSSKDIIPCLIRFLTSLLSTFRTAVANSI